MPLLRYGHEAEELPPIPGFLEEESWVGNAVWQVAAVTLAMLGTDAYQQVEEIPTAPAVTIVEEADQPFSIVRVVVVPEQVYGIEELPIAAVATIVEEVDQPLSFVRAVAFSDQMYGEEEYFLPTAGLVEEDGVLYSVALPVRWAWFIPLAEEQGEIILGVGAGWGHLVSDARNRLVVR